MSHYQIIRKNWLIFLVVFFSFVIFSATLPIFSTMFIGNSVADFIAHISLEKRKILLGFLIAAFPLGQFLSFPLLGRLSDIYGRRPLLLMTSFFTIPFIFLTAVAIHFGNLLLLFSSMFLTGVFEGSFTIAEANLVDTSNNSLEKVKKFGWLITFESAGFIFGPVLGGFLSDPSVISWFSFSTPFWFNALLSIILFILVFLKFKESLVNKNSKKTIFDRELLPFFGIFSLKKLTPLFTGNFFIYFAYQLFFIFLPTFLIYRFGFNSLRLGLVEAYISFFVLFIPFIQSKLSTYVAHKRMVEITTLLYIFAIIFVLITRSPYFLFLTLLPIGLVISTCIAYAKALLSDVAKPSIQGEALSIDLTVYIFCEIAAAILGGFLASFFAPLPLIIAAIFSFIAFLWFLFLRKNKLG